MFLLFFFRSSNATFISLYCCLSLASRVAFSGALMPAVNAVELPIEPMVKASVPTELTWSNIIEPHTFDDAAAPIPHSTHFVGGVPRVGA
ncbi:MAG: hypothetical protein EBY28_13090 [Betaproteobacteria bacterium]|nr:hypothetical protein [Betaproteobacteria bacterium]